MSLRSRMLRAAAGAGAAPPVLTDPKFNYVSLLLNDTGTNGQQNNTFLDSSTNNFTITRNGTPTQGSVTPYWPDGQWSNYFSGSTQYLTVATNAAFTYGTGNFTIEGWFQISKTGATQYLVDQRNSGTASAVIPSIYVSSGNVLIYYVSGSAQITGTTTLSVGVWYHFAVSRSGTSTKLFLNGMQEGSTYSDSNNYAASRVVLASEADTAANYLQGYLSNVRLVNGTALYASNFTPSTTPLTAVSGTSLLTCQSNRFKDNSSNNFAITVTGTPTVQAFEPFEPSASYATSVGGSGYFSGSGNYISIPGTVNQNLIGNSNFTIEAWVYSATSSFNQTILSHTDMSSGRGFGWNLRYESGYNIKFYVGSGTAGSDNEFLTATSTGIKINEWNHVAVVRNGATVYVYVNGVQKGSAAMPATFNVTGTVPFQVGQRGTSLPEPIIGYVTNARVVAGTAVYTANFTPPTSPVTAITNTSLLLNFTNAGIYDAATLNDLVTVGDAKVSTAQAKWGGSSMAFDGTGDYLTATNTLPFVFGTGDWTVETWVNPSVRQLQRIYDSRPGSNGAYVTIGMNASGNFDYTANSALRITGTTVASTGTWYHVAVCRSGTSTRLFVNGVQEGVTYTDSTNYIVAAGRPFIGADSFSAGATPWNGYMDDFRVTKGYARYTANFTPPTAPFPTR